MFKGVEHTAIASPDPRALAEWYAAHLEFVINYEYAGNYFVRAANGAMLEIIPGKGPLTPPQFDDPGIRHLAIDVDDFDAAHQRLQGRRRALPERADEQTRKPPFVFCGP